MNVRQLGKGTAWLQEFEVEGTVDFPLDMLRYDACWPARGEDAGTIARTFDRECRLSARRDDAPFRVRLRRSAPGKECEPTVERWRSFGWDVI